LDIWLYLLGAILGVQVLLRRSDKPLLPESFKERFAKSGKSEEVTPPLQS